MECEFCYDKPSLTILFPKGREIYICKDVICLGRVNEIALDEKEDKVLSIKDWEFAS